MGSARFRRPDGRFGNYGDWLAEVAAKWAALSRAEQTESRDKAAVRFRNSVTEGDGPAQLHFYDEIGWFGVWPQDVVDTLSDIRGDVEIHVNSPGGSVTDGLAIYQALRERNGQVGVVIDGMAASAASFIAMAASPGLLEIAPKGVEMIHDAWGMAIGNEADLRTMADLLGDMSANIASIYADRGTLTEIEYRDLMRAETWLVGQKAVNKGLADRVRGDAAPRRDDGGASLASLPWAVEIRSASGMHGDHARIDPDGDGDCDACPEGDTDHDYWGEDGEPVRPLPGNRLRNAAADESAWDGSAAMSAAAGSDNPAAAYKAICAGRKAGDPDLQSSWALPHHKHPGDAPNAAGVKNALGRLPQTQGLTNEAAAKAHLEAHMRAINPDYEPDDTADDYFAALMEGKP